MEAIKSAMFVLVAVLAFSFAVAQDDSDETFNCPDKKEKGFYSHQLSCDRYWECDSAGNAKLKTCGNGLAFDDTDPRHGRENCDYLFTVDCGDRVELEPPISTQFCPRLYGVFPDEEDCGVFYSCWSGEAKKYNCAAGLAFDQVNRVCVWADQVPNCKSIDVAEGFQCPDPATVEQSGSFTRHAHPDDCRKFFVCLEGVARMYGCSIGTVFNTDTNACDDPENVSGCEKYYGDVDLKALKKAQAAGGGFVANKKSRPQADDDEDDS